MLFLLYMREQQILFKVVLMRGNHMGSNLVKLGGKNCNERQPSYVKTLKLSFLEPACTAVSVLFKGAQLCLLNSHRGFCGGSVFEMEMVGCWLVGIPVHCWLQLGNQRLTFSDLANCPAYHLWPLLMSPLQYLCRLNGTMMDRRALCGLVCLNRRSSVKILATVM